MQIIKKIFAVILGLVIGSVFITLVEKVNSTMYPLPEGMDATDIEAFKAFVAGLPDQAFILIFIGHICGALVGGLVSWLIVKNTIIPSMIVGALFTVAGLFNLFMIHHPWWMWTEVALYMPAAYLGTRLLKK
ncbi:MAG: hypothetical protein ACK4WD_09820 [Flavobacteriales bacterium]|jgi:hypothetical protein